ncbi:MAG TPA: hypothetical protein VF412_17725 [Bdellovibrio sp.]|uniref:hypothetical protein n=1 Tax=Bdellovibrio sp. TaxID=28201 RepID=UPI002EE06335
MKNWAKVAVSALMVFSGTFALAEDSQTVNTTTTKATGNNKAPSQGEQVDDLITNNNLRAYSGSTSRWSIASAFNYNGGTVNTPLSQDRPNISDASGNTVKADLDGSISVKYNLNVQNSLMAGVGLRWIAPFEKNGPRDYSGTTTDVMNPYLQYQYLYKWTGIQSVLQVSAMKWTQADQTAFGYDYQLGVDQENVYEIGSTGLSVGASIMGQFQGFNKSGSYSGNGTFIADLKTQQSTYAFALSPYLEYQITDKVNFRTLISLWSYEHYASDNAGVYVHDKVYQSVGIGYALTRDIFLYPNVQFLPDQMEPSLTNVALSATINMF